jgi:hypothetical protein
VSSLALGVSARIVLQIFLAFLASLAVQLLILFFLGVLGGSALSIHESRFTNPVPMISIQ